MEKEKTSKEKILKAAKIIFAQKGKDGARMDEIAELSGLNKAMIYYYFESKDTIYKEILQTFFLEGFNKIFEIFKKPMTLKEKITNLVDFYINHYSNNPEFIKIMFRESINDGIDIKNILKEMTGKIDFLKANFLINLFEEEKKLGTMRSCIDIRNLIMSIIGMSFIYFLFKPISKGMMYRDQENIEFDENEFLKNRKEHIIDLILNGIKEKE